MTEFNEFVRSVKFTEDKEKKEEPASWPEPKGWHKDPPGGVRYAGLSDRRGKPKGWR